MFISNPDYTDDHPAMDPEFIPPPERATLDDVFGAAPDPHGGTRVEVAAPSDMPRLEREHVTAGYRDGVTAAKGSSVQEGFDEGFGLGAEVGQRVGEILGLLEGIHEAVGGDGEVLKQAREELKVEKVFGKEFWLGDGTWRYEVRKEGDIVFADVADAHPLVKKWSEVVEGEVRRWGIDMGILGTSTEMAGEEVKNEEELSVKPVAEAKKNALDW